ncbi:predicted protein [Naegleria gruberi]|uniref:Predicted protein n=1 Tax=Naegleria gruberi TaxID=5762 RepID=D2VKM0_NAEGR|nr:uncharacterized protein NAEGRDRAFT_69441 [Naegleria gruberi]EFC42621.1 predicted protein [Naegleria gruberi]|eukprot:XP_002675365.1 predicted protein [Naegleria gruberi strain NEG-M]
MKGVRVRVLARNPSMLSPLDSKYSDRLSIVKGDATKAEDVAQLISNSQVSHVICALGVRMNEPTTVVENGVINAISVMKKLDREMRFVLVTSSALVKSNSNWFFDNIVKKHLLNHIYDDLERAEKALVELTKDSKISYAIVRPPQLVDAPATLDLIYKEGDEQPKGTHLVTREDVASVLLECIFDKQFNTGNRIFNVDTTRKLDVKVDVIKILRSVTPYPKYLMIRSFMFSIQAAIGFLIGFSLFKLKSLLFPQLEEHIIKYLSKHK